MQIGSAMDQTKDGMQIGSAINQTKDGDCCDVVDLRSPVGSIKEQVEDETCSGARGLSTSIGSHMEQSVTFKLGRAEANPGESFLIVGSHDALGCWDPSSGLRMTTDPEKYPTWTATANLSSEDSTDIEYKYVLDRRESSGDYVWESCENRKLSLSFEIARAWEKADEGFGQPGTCLKQIECCLESDQAQLQATNIPDAISLHNNQDAVAQRFASFSCLDQLIDDANDLVGLRAQIQEEWKCEFQCEERPARYGARHLSTPIVIVTSEINPWSKTGGLAMITASYAFEFAFRGHRTMAISPMYADYDRTTCIGNAFIELGGEHHEVRYFHQKHIYGDGKSCDYIFVDHPCFRRSEGMYGPPGGEYADNLFRFTLFAIAAAEAPLILEIDGSTFGQDVLFMCNDWQTGILPVYLLYKYKKHNVYVNARSMMVIHNIGYQGKYAQSKFPLDSFFHLPPSLAGPDLEGEDMHLGTDCINLLAGGIRTADRVLTVSPNYAHEIQSGEGGQGLHGILQARAREDRLAGILNGISDEWSPAIDPHIAKNYCVSDFKEGKRICKEALQRELGLNVDPNVCLIGFCGRLCFQKGLSLFMPLIHWLLNDLEGGRSQLIIMGKGEDEWACKVEEAERMNRGRVCGYVGFDPRVEHRMMAGCDLLLMPSQYEPCGLPQMYAQVYGTLPIVHETGGLKDSVRGLWDEGADKDTATGFPFCGFSQDSLKQRLCQAIWMFHHNTPVWQKMQTNAMNLDHYWPTRLDEYEEQVDLTMEGWPQRKAESWWTNHW
jgi:starch synthase